MTVQSGQEAMKRREIGEEGNWGNIFTFRWFLSGLKVDGVLEKGVYGED
jgi:hypothetical protein